MIASPLAHAQGESLDVLVTNSLQRMNENKWAEALTMLDRATGMPNLKTLYGSKIGILFYRKGICQSRLNQFDEAMKSFETCYRDLHDF